jgi:hypothetical protein
VSSLVYLGLSLILFVITYGIAFTIMPMIFGAFFTVADTSGLLNATACVTAPDSPACAWSGIYEQNETTVKYLVPLMPTMGIVIIVIKVLMTAAARGRD